MVRAFTCEATNDSSPTPTTYASELSFTSVTHWLTNDGSIIRSACGSTTWRSVPQRVSPSDSPAAHCPAPMPRMPACTACAR
ncbi:hypothetical protein D3C72_2154680 [compost metagenome]